MTLMSPHIYRAQFLTVKGDEPYWRFFKQEPRKGPYNPQFESPYEWLTSRQHDRGYYAVASDWVIELHEDGIIITVPPLGKSIVGYIYDHAEEERLAATLSMVTVASAAEIEKARRDAKHQASVNEGLPPVGELAAEISKNHVWLKAGGSVIRIEDIECVMAVKDQTGFEGSLIIMRSGAQVTIALPLEILYPILEALDIG